MCLLRGRSTPAIRAMLSLPLFVLRVLADDPHHAVAANHLALVANLLYRCSYLHENPSRQLPVTGSQLCLATTGNGNRQRFTCIDTQCARASNRTATVPPRRGRLEVCG